MVFKGLNNLSPEYISDMISPQTESTHGTRRNKDAFLLSVPPPPHYNRTNAAFSISAPKVWNSLPYSIRSQNDLNVFKSSLKTYYFQQAFNTPDETYDDAGVIM